MAQSTVICEICDKREYEQICIDCDQYFCQECKEGHIKTKTTKDHTFHYSATFQPQYKKLRCRKHEQHFIFFCEKCQSLVCPICLPENHQEHRMLKIDEVASIKKKELNETLKTFITKLNEFESEVNSIQNITEKCKGENKDVIQHVDEQAKHISNVLENQRRCIIKSVKQKAKTEEKRISILLEDLQHCMKEAKELERKVKLDLHGSDTSLLSNFQLSKSKVSTFEFQDTSISTCPVQFSKYNVTKEELSLLESIFTGNLCGLSEHEERNTLKSLMSKHDVNIEELQKELTNQIQIRLSSIAGEKLTKGNPSITDLGDPNRPMKISEMYGELYDNEWTDCMECTDVIKPQFKALDHSELEEIIIHHLYRLLLCCYKECRMISENQIRTIRKSIEENLFLDTESEKDGVNVPGCKEVLFFRKQNGKEYATQLISKQKLCGDVMKEWEYCNKSDILMQHLLKTAFFDKCVHLCWFMCIQEPMMFLHQKLLPGETFDKNEYKEFVKSGNKVGYIVWPALFLHENGPLLYKGVVQAYN